MVKKVKKEKKYVAVGNAYVTTSFNNTKITITDTNGNVIAWCSSGINKFKGAKKSTPFAAQTNAEIACKKARDFGLKNIIYLYIKGPGAGKESAARVISQYFKVQYIKEITPVPHNGCRPRKKRRV
ncbi:30S ribosomal protein S11 [Rickettsiales endosymbiont of Stachyamoeba lipophora]|uniref:30S ribosomal protein S11 n=1 Tax=Rickettsiales endosymbiont of Stachyamoeba lipophora TaxID=2486578 RepID=UPI000F64FC20|nr:30S ribosomal protein S11 [Rickettsiales endosymbiont of Stachyamoeba lipophora]AZL15887.1 30S ribosomal protein S11 [Rickettsiales endosymbiont of Stachyamoeba lipophora]